MKEKKRPDWVSAKAGFARKTGPFAMVKKELCLDIERMNELHGSDVYRIENGSVQLEVYRGDGIMCIALVRVDLQSENGDLLISHQGVVDARITPTWNP